ncbi:MAG: hypothetical protein JNG88_07675 [Phycisphaerales bacterium]|nr:hypothetical protein [Phycisphaerales bacterium]
MKRLAACWFVLLTFAAAGCSSGRIGGVYILDHGLVVADADKELQRAVLVTDAKLVPVQGAPIPALKSGEWIVFQRFLPRAHLVKTSRLRADQRLPQMHADRLLFAVHADTGRQIDVPHPWDNGDDIIDSVIQVENKLVAAVKTRYVVQTQFSELRYFECSLPQCEWEAIPENRGRKLVPRDVPLGPFADLRASAAPTDRDGRNPRKTTAPRWSGITTFEEFQRRGLHRGEWGQLTERERDLRWEAVLKRPDGREIVLLRQNDAGTASVIDLAIPKEWRPR